MELGGLAWDQCSKSHPISAYWNGCSFRLGYWGRITLAILSGSASSYYKNLIITVFIIHLNIYRNVVLRWKLNKCCYIYCTNHYHVGLNGMFKNWSLNEKNLLRLQEELRKFCWLAFLLIMPDTIGY